MLFLPTALRLRLLRPMSKLSHGISHLTHGDAMTENTETNKKGLFLSGVVPTPIDFGNNNRYFALLRIAPAV